MHLVAVIALNFHDLVTDEESAAGSYPLTFLSLSLSLSLSLLLSLALSLFFCALSLSVFGFLASYSSAERSQCL